MDGLIDAIKSQTEAINRLIDLVAVLIDSNSSDDANDNLSVRYMDGTSQRP